MSEQLPAYRISHAALGKILASVIEMEIREKIEPEQFYDTVLAVYNRIIDPNHIPPGYSEHNRDVYEEMSVRIEKSARRSAIAREAARRRKERKEESLRNLEHHRQAPDVSEPADNAFTPAPADNLHRKSSRKKKNKRKRRRR